MGGGMKGGMAKVKRSERLAVLEIELEASLGAPIAGFWALESIETSGFAPVTKV
jgi:hypothetical protein